MRRFSQWLINFSTSKVSMFVLIIFLLFTSLVLPKQSQKASELSGARSPDLSLFYSSSDLFQMAESYGPAGRAAYVQARIEFDILWPLVYGVFLCVSMSWFLQRLLSSANPWRLLNLLPILAVMFDFLENLSTATVMQLYPQSPQWALLSAPFFTPVKWLWVGCCFLLVVILFSILIVQKWRAQVNK